MLFRAGVEPALRDSAGDFQLVRHHRWGVVLGPSEGSGLSALLVIYSRLLGRDAL